MKSVKDTKKGFISDDMQRILDANLDHRKHIMKQLKAFAKDDSYFELYDGHEFGQDENLIRLFVYKPPKEFRPSFVRTVPNQSTIEGSSGMKPKTYYIDDIPMPYGKVIKAGKASEGNTQYADGDIVTLFSNRVMGYQQNPEWVRYWQALDGQMGMTAKATEPDPNIPNIEINYDSFKYIRVGNLYPDMNDRLTYLLPSYDIRKYTGV